MTQKLTNFLNGAKNKEFATSAGTQMHSLLQRIVIDDTYQEGNEDIIKIIAAVPDLMPFFTSNAKTEVPIAGNINGHIVSRRIDRLLINHDSKIIDFIDYKTDTDKFAFLDKYKLQLKEYAQLLCSAYPNYKINGYILWLHDWELDKII